MCARARLVFLLACACSVFCNAGPSCENSSRQVLRVLVLSCCRNESEAEARATPGDDGRPGTEIWLNPGVVPPPTTPAVPLGCISVLGGDWYTLMGAFALAFATRRCMGDHKSLEAGGALMEVKWKWMWLR